MRAPVHLLQPAGRSLASRLPCHSGASPDGLTHLDWFLLVGRSVEQVLARMIVVAQVLAAEAELAVVEVVGEVDTLAEVGGEVVVAGSERSQARNHDSLVDNHAAAFRMVEVEAVRYC